MWLIKKQDNKQKMAPPYVMIARGTVYKVVDRIIKSEQHRLKGISVSEDVARNVRERLKAGSGHLTSGELDRIIKES